MVSRRIVSRTLVGGSIVVFAAAATSYFAAQQSSEQPGSTQRNAAGQTSGDTQNQTTENQNATGQNQNGQNAVGQNGQNAAGMHGRHDVVHYMRDCLVHGNQGEIALARIAEQRAADPQVKQFAQKMIQDHTAFMSKLQNASGGSNASGGNSAEQTGSAQQAGQPAVGGPGADANAPGTQVRAEPGESNSATPAADATARRGSQTMAGGGARQFVQIQKEVAAQCLQSMTRELNQKEGAQFDRCYMNMQVGAHMKMADELAVYSRYGAGDFQSMCQEGLQTTKEHLAMAKQIAERLAGANPGQANRNPNGSNQ